MKEHIQAAMVNELRDVAKRHHNYDSLRELIKQCVDKYLKMNGFDIARVEYFD